MAPGRFAETEPEPAEESEPQLENRENSRSRTLTRYCAH